MVWTVLGSSKVTRDLPSLIYDMTTEGREAPRHCGPSYSQRCLCTNRNRDCRSACWRICSVYPDALISTPRATTALMPLAPTRAGTTGNCTVQSESDGSAGNAVGHRHPDRVWALDASCIPKAKYPLGSSLWDFSLQVTIDGLVGEQARDASVRGTLLDHSARGWRQIEEEQSHRRVWTMGVGSCSWLEQVPWLQGRQRAIHSPTVVADSFCYGGPPRHMSCQAHVSGHSARQTRLP